MQKIFYIGPNKEIEVSLSPGQGEHASTLSFTHIKGMSGDFYRNDISYEDLSNLAAEINMFLMRE